MKHFCQTDPSAEKCGYLIVGSFKKIVNGLENGHRLPLSRFHIIKNGSSQHYASKAEKTYNNDPPDDHPVGRCVTHGSLSLVTENTNSPETIKSIPLCITIPRP
ncbi:hypothetical protein AMK06_CH00562 [Rhizobium sp. N541]|nr:hypothetical protein AMK05_CH00547 [Rhizobium sp. N324]ANM15507.1 hypothetical protein AMK06_CH00562 [Rhizobium sp. N541]ANM21895.1 hypothetical protein AMK07_CH00562 [Rhizobium sp. N941]OYD02551.1 hypothetical protein AMK08_CH100544 [Rhizobium sp. N4311]